MIKKEKCLQCKKDFIPRGYVKRKFCSLKCFHDSTIRKVKQACLFCGAEFLTHPSNIPAKRGKFCSQECRYSYPRKKKGAKKIGSIKIAVCGNKKPRRLIKVRDAKGDNEWEFYARYIWEQVNGKIPEGYVIHHVNKDRLDDRIENLLLLSPTEHIIMHKDDLDRGREMKGAKT